MADDTFDGNTDAAPIAGDIIIPGIGDPSGTPYDARFTPANIADFLNNYVITPSISTNNLVVALKTLAGSDPSATSDHIIYRIGDTHYSITSALSLTIPAGGNTFDAGSAEHLGSAIEQFVYLRYNATDGVCIGTSRIPFARLYSDFSTNGDDETMTDQKGAVWNDITNATAGDVCVNIGYFEVQNAGAAGYEWSAVANVISEPTFNSGILTWTPSPTNLTVGSGTGVYWYQRTGKSVRGSYSFILAADSAVGGAVTITMPIAKSSSYSGTTPQPGFACRLFDATAAPAYQGVAVLNTNSTLTIVAQDAGVAYVKQTPLAAAVPFTWTTSDQIVFDFEYLAD